MALVVETGYGLTGADSYASVEEADAYWARMGGNATWDAATVPQKEVALRRASEFIDINWLAGLTPLNVGQGLYWPSDTWEEAHLYLLRRATVQVAPHAVAGPLVEADAVAPLVTQETNKVGEISESRQYANPEPAVSARGMDFSYLGAILAPLTGTGGMVIARRQRA